MTKMYKIVSNFIKNVIGLDAEDTLFKLIEMILYKDKKNFILET